MDNIASTIITSATRLIVALFFAFITAVFLPWLKKTVIPWLKEKHLYEVIKILVEAAEKQAEAGTIEKFEKKKYVIDLLLLKGIEITPEVDATIEAAVKELDMASIQSATLIGAAFDEAQEAPEE